jgi:hypothetical protein
MVHLLPEGADVESASAMLAEHLNVRSGRPRGTTITFFDSFDGRLYDEGVTLHHSDGRLVLTDRADGEELASADGAARPRLFDHDLPDPLRARLSDAIEMRALLPVAKVRGRRLPIGVLNEDAKTVVRLVVETHERLHGRVHATAVRGYDRDLDGVRELLETALGLVPATTPLVDEAIAAGGGDPAGTSAKLALELDPEQPASEAAHAVFARLLEVIDANLPGTVDDVDSEFLHDLRVAASRRSASAPPARTGRRRQSPCRRTRRSRRTRSPCRAAPGGRAASDWPTDSVRRRCRHRSRPPRTAPWSAPRPRVARPPPGPTG